MAEANYRVKLAEFGATPLYTTWLGNNKRHQARCTNGHECAPIPSNLQNGQGVCRVCAGNDPATAEAKFLTVLANMGATPLYPAWLGVESPHRVRCAAGHERMPRPHGVLAGQGVCLVCAGKDPVTAEANFRARLAELGATPLYTTPWRGIDTRYLVRCKAGHECTPTPHYVQSGGGVCLACARKTWDAFYVVVNRSHSRVKFGITAGHGRRRLGDHRSAGYSDVVLLAIDQPDAAQIERAVIGALANAGVLPVKGREYFDVSALPLVLDVAAGWVTAATVGDSAA